MCKIGVRVKEPTILLIVFGVVRPSEPSAQTKVRELYVPVPVDEYIVRLDVPVKDNIL